MSDTDTISVSQLIELVRDRPVLWDRQKEVYKNRKLTRKAWIDICETLVENYHELGDQEQKAIGRSVISKWANLRDNWLRYWRKRQQLLLSGSSTSTLKKYIHHDQLLFLSKVYDPECQQEVEEIQVDVDVISDPEMASSPALSSGETSQNMWSFQEEETNKPPETDGHIYFFYGVLPLIKDFNNEQTIDFQIAVFECIKRIRVKGVNKQFHSPPHCHFSDQSQESLPDQGNISNTENISVYTHKRIPQDPQQTAHKQNVNGPFFLETVNDGNDVISYHKKTTEESNSDKKPTQEIGNNVKMYKGLSNLNKAISRLEKISKKISVSSLEDSYDRFGKYIVSLLRKFPPKNIKIFRRKLIKFISSHLASSSENFHVFIGSQKRSQKYKESQENMRKRFKESNRHKNEVNTLINDITSTEDKFALEAPDSNKVPICSFSEDQASSSSYFSYPNHPILVKNISQTTFLKLNQTSNNKRKNLNS